MHIKEDVQEAVSRGIEEGITRIMRKNNFRKKIVAIDQHHRSSDGMLRIYPRGDENILSADDEIKGRCIYSWLPDVVSSLSSHHNYDAINYYRRCA